MQRLIEQLADDGDMLDGGTRLGRVHYHLSVYSLFSDTKGQSGSAFLTVEGQITPLDSLDLAALHRQHTELGLRLADGRTLTFSMVNAEGRIRSTGRGLHTPPTSSGASTSTTPDS
jgi:hypothetical protein